ncbi:hypothetical protein IQ247_06065 [Plectonema cf. radiosum LEGE 06105]|uniref:DUF5673 domain-containing protein n=1 Tax=Plectonema cf. radiosum LEGE 06105 TaxID=945769 RepID=A0A8J7K1U3_9CYAN|nr:DUF5673 domain-containing protein [Plectonema radiosum]MBE9212277.1 hypothetical protein [Plectonema cf. radiosum LEGE 06105]
MNWFVVVGTLVAAIIGLGFGYFIASFIVGKEAAQRNLRSVLPIGVFIGVLIAFSGYYLSNIEFLLLVLAVLSLIFIIGSLVIWFWRKQKTGSLLLNVGRTRSHWLILGTGIIFLLLAVGQTYTLITQTSEFFSEDNNILLFNLVINWALAILLLVSGLSKLELREKAICFMTAVIRWDEIKSYKWEGKQQNILTIWLKKRFLGLPNFKILPIPLSKKAAVEAILSEHLS